jgi:hypothetical protein
MVKRKWVRFGIIPIEKKFGQVLEGCIRAKDYTEICCPLTVYAK